MKMDKDRTDALFQQSGMFRAKWLEARRDRTYGQLTIHNAAAWMRSNLVGGQFTPSRQSGPIVGDFFTSAARLFAGDQGVGPRALAKAIGVKKDHSKGGAA